MSKPSLTLILGLGVALAVACNSDSAAPGERVLTTLEIGRANTILFAEDTSQLMIATWDQFGVPMLEHSDHEWTNKARYVSSSPAIAKVSSGGLVTGVSEGTAKITATLTLAGYTASNYSVVTIVGGAPKSATVTANGLGAWYPTTVTIRVGGTVTWVIPDGLKIGTVWLNVWDANAEILEFTNGRATRTYSAPGSFYYGNGHGLMWYEGGGLVRVY